MAAAVDQKIPAFENTSLDDITRVTDTLRATFRSYKTKDVQWRLVQLRKFYWAFEDHIPALINALRQDLRKSKHEALLSEINWIKDDCLYLIKNLERFTKDEPVGDVPMTFIMMKPRVRKEPLGMVLVIGAYNFPAQLSLVPLLGAVAAGCTAVLKPSEGAPATAMVLKKIVEASLDPSAYAVVNGAVDETTALLEVKWDKIMYTGGAAVGKIISKKAAETLTPVCLELGGLNPAFVTRNADIKLAARRLGWGKTLNAGQVCLSQNYILADRAAVPRTALTLSRIVNARHFARMKKMLDSTEGEIVVGGGMDEAQLFIEPTIVLANSPHDSVVREESFGPIFAILPYDSLDAAIELVNDLCHTPLALFAFGNEAETKKSTSSSRGAPCSQTTSGGATINDVFSHASILTVPFGGVGQSGHGSYRGRASFDLFTHRRSVAQVPSWLDKFLRVRYMPYSPKELARLQSMSAGKPDFDRSGNQIRGLGYWFSFLTGFGAKTVKGALLRWIVALVAAVLAKKRGLI
ncbi:aldehyde dehydrogenase 3I1 [Verticillium alfalfae VaMs.102]|uniref:Aldehyde dehydrogenase n=1 Tax=Verticillium alfalfae (strain VaMs.102 / ATCC MYA-4576 / FGSC 10136) TaxID=526221 RepID=C9SGM7_VERA1|nr:aldehyde dehydrogenase 3I1 [Verticillium alfalfae VaMs.102]EEY18149.1 aldehyde dehydrogenase 3I1 [Verticillium alfalfae VaMs.102]